VLTFSTLAVFAASTLALLAVPGPSVVYVVARSVEHGRTAGLVSMLGLEAGALVHVVLAAVGVTAVLASSPWAFTVVRVVGAGYLLVMGVRQLVRRGHGGGNAEHVGGPASASRWRLFRDGVLVDVLNPKTALFFLAFLPQFVEPARGAVPLQVLLLGVCFVGLAAVVDSTYALAASALRRRRARSERSSGRLQKVTGLVYLGLGGLVAVA
jgi:threonine/homoserine/homoserine lactone efflux protein